MGRNRFVDPESVRVDLSDGDWIEIKQRLTSGEQRHVDGAALVSRRDDGDLGVSFEKFVLAKLEAWLVDWSFTDGKGKPVPLSRSAILALDSETAAEIDAAITAQIEALDAAKKATTTGSTGPTPTSPS